MADSVSGLDCANQRYYSSNLGRFMSPDPYKARAGRPTSELEPIYFGRE